MLAPRMGRKRRAGVHGGRRSRCFSRGSLCHAMEEEGRAINRWIIASRLGSRKTRASELSLFIPLRMGLKWPHPIRSGGTMRKVLVIHGPNLNLLGEREPGIYGSTTLEEINRDLQEQPKKLGVELRTAQSNHEGEIVETIQNARHWAEVILINPA